MRKLHALILLALLWFGAPGLGFGVSATPADFNQARLESGRFLYAEKRYLEAIDQFRIAAFGFLNRPDLLSTSLCRLVLAQSAANRLEDADATILRFLELQRRFPSYPPPGLEPETRSEFQSLMLRRVPEGTLLGIPALAGIVETEEQKIAKLPPADRRKALEAASRRDPTSTVWLVGLARDAAERGDWKETDRWAGKALSLQPSNPEALALRGRARLMRGEVAQARQDFSALSPAEMEKHPEIYADVFVGAVEASDWAVADETSSRIPAALVNRADVARAREKLAAERQRRAAPPQAVPASQRVAAPATTPVPDAAALAARSRDVLSRSRQLVLSSRAGEAQRLLTEALRADPENRELRLALLEAACLTRSYRDGAVQVELVAPFGETEGPSMFYAAVVLYETGKADEARGYMRRAVPRVSGPLVDEYSKKILGP